MMDLLACENFVKALFVGSGQSTDEVETLFNGLDRHPETVFENMFCFIAKKEKLNFTFGVIFGVALSRASEEPGFKEKMQRMLKLFEELHKRGEL